VSPGGARRELGSLDQGDTETTQGQVVCECPAGAASAHDQDVSVV